MLRIRSASAALSRRTSIGVVTLDP